MVSVKSFARKAKVTIAVLVSLVGLNLSLPTINSVLATELGQQPRKVAVPKRQGVSVKDIRAFIFGNSAGLLLILGADEAHNNKDCKQRIYENAIKGDWGIRFKDRSDVLFNNGNGKVAIILTGQNAQKAAQAVATQVTIITGMKAYPYPVK